MGYDTALRPCAHQKFAAGSAVKKMKKMGASSKLFTDYRRPWRFSPARNRERGRAEQRHQTSCESSRTAKQAVDQPAERNGDPGFGLERTSGSRREMWSGGGQ